MMCNNTSCVMNAIYTYCKLRFQMALVVHPRWKFFSRDFSCNEVHGWLRKSPLNYHINYTVITYSYLSLFLEGCLSAKATKKLCLFYSHFRCFWRQMVKLAELLIGSQGNLVLNHHAFSGYTVTFCLQWHFLSPKKDLLVLKIPVTVTFRLQW